MKRESPSLRGRGLKLRTHGLKTTVGMSPSLRGRGLKCISLSLSLCSGSSSPSLRGRGLKYTNNFGGLPICVSPSLRGRGLKSDVKSAFYVMNYRRPLYEGVDWNPTHAVKNISTLRRPLYEGVDWNTKERYNIDNETRSPSLRGRGLKFAFWYLMPISIIVALFTRAWIEIRSYWPARWGRRVALFTRAWIEIFF